MCEVSCCPPWKILDKELKKSGGSLRRTLPLKMWEKEKNKNNRFHKENGDMWRWDFDIGSSTEDVKSLIQREMWIKHRLPKELRT
jgi:hypothetical protein